jgi:hypothetical protein
MRNSKTQLVCVFAKIGFLFFDDENLGDSSKARCIGRKIGCYPFTIIDYVPNSFRGIVVYELEFDRFSKLGS